jgi:hypothetical protein
MQTTKERLTPATYKEIWAVVIGKETFFLNEIQVGVLKNAMVSGNRGAIWFEKFAISIPHVQCVYLVEKRQTNVLTAGKEKEMTAEEREKALKKLAEVRKELSQKLILDKKKK